MREYRLLSTTHGLVASGAGRWASCWPCRSTASARPDLTTGAIRGIARVVDGDTIDIGDTRIRLEGIDAPEAGQTCKRKWFGSWPCGAVATAALARMVENRSGELRAARPRQVRAHAGRLLRRRPGHQCADGAPGPRLGVRQVLAELREGGGAGARGEPRHLAGRVEAPWDYRAKRWAAAEQQAPEGCAIKGNVTKNGRIYHMPWSPWYAQIKMEADKGKRWFCTEAEALAAGWRPGAGALGFRAEPFIALRAVGLAQRGRAMRGRRKSPARDWAILKAP